LRRFTLTDLTIVLAVLLLFLALVFGVIGKLRGRGMRTACQNELRRMGFAASLYIAGNDDFLPPISTGQFPHVQLYTDLIGEYVDAKTAWLCPKGDMTPDRIGSANGKLLHYGMNDFGYGVVDDALRNYYPSLGEARVTVLREPAAVILAADSAPQNSPEDIGTEERCSNDWPLSSLATRRHDKGYNALYLGGAVRWRANRPNHWDWTCRKRLDAIPQ
jgi:hypothetical protein